MLQLRSGSPAINAGSNLYLNETDTGGTDLAIDLNNSGIIGDYALTADRDGANRTESGTVDMGAYEFNLSPVLAPIGDKAVEVSQLLTFIASAINRNGSPTGLTYSLSGAVPAGATIGFTSGVFNWVPNPSQGGNIHKFSVVVSNGAQTDREEIAVTVGAINTAPELGAIGDLLIDELQTLTFTATATDAESPPQTLSYGLAGSVPVGATINQTTGVFNWTPTESQGPGQYTFTVVVSDGDLTDGEEITVTVAEVTRLRQRSLFPPIKYRSSNRSAPWSGPWKRSIRMAKPASPTRWSAEAATRQRSVFGCQQRTPNRGAVRLRAARLLFGASSFCRRRRTGGRAGLSDFGY